MFDEFFKWLISTLTSTALLGVIIYFSRSALTKLIGKSIEHRFDKKIENFKSEIRDKEKELEQIRVFMASTRRERDSTLQTKRFEAAEILMRSRQFLGQFTMLVEYVKMLNMNEILDKRNDPKITQFIKALTDPVDIDEKLRVYGTFDRTLPELYLNDRVKKLFEAYQFIILNAVMIMKVLSMPGININPDLFKKDSLRKTVIELAPLAKEGFDQFGDSYAYHWTNYFYEEILKELRNELLGITSLSKDTEAATKLALDTRRAQVNLHTKLEENGLSENLINPDAR
ncbi:hypothetical protein ACJYFV_13305 [Enterobacter asburiae]|uniref:hypothetical protein n=1 Tax=Enterobacter cloacae complex TaxID=354276 RepID=UPI0018E9B7FB|nr:hypothetical protein [Enterobacter asburiae]MBJ3796768.1 hypothetical protein [Enterobacter asburiae]